MSRKNRSYSPSVWLHAVWLHAGRMFYNDAEPGSLKNSNVSTASSVSGVRNTASANALAIECVANDLGNHFVRA
jgi:hypothetical protein